MQKKNKLILCISLFVLLLTTIWIIWWQLNNIMKEAFYIEIQSENKTEQINLWQNTKDEYYIFLPSYSELSECLICLDVENVWIEDKKLTESMSCEEFDIGMTYKLEVNYFGKKKIGTITFIKSGNLPTMYIETESGNMEYVHESKENKEKAMMSIYTENGKIDYSGELKSIKGHGNQTWDEFEKKSYNIEVTSEEELLNMGNASKWILLSNVYDVSNLRNKLVYDFADEVGLEYSPDSKWIDLYINHEYVGLYLLCEKNEISDNRIDIEKNGSCLISIEREDRLKKQNYPYILTQENQALRIRDGQREYDKLEELWQNIENLILESDSEKLFEAIDIDSWVKKYLIEEIFGNLDGCLISQFFYYDNNSKLVYAGPVWDYDHAIGNDYDEKWNITNPRTSVVNRQLFSELNFSWWQSLYDNETFYNYMISIYSEEMLPAIKQLLDEQIDIYVEKIVQASYMNKVRWDSLYKDYDFQVEVEKVTNYIVEHIDYLNKLWLEKNQYYQISAENSTGTNLYYSVVSGEQCNEIPLLDDMEDKKFVGWYYCDTDEHFDQNQPIYKDTEIYAKWEESSLKQMKKIGKLIPFGVILIMGIAFLIIDISRTKRNG